MTISEVVADPPQWTASSLIWLNRGARIAVVTVERDSPPAILTAMRWLVGPDGSVALDHGSLAGEAAARARWADACKGGIKPPLPNPTQPHRASERPRPNQTRTHTRKDG